MVYLDDQAISKIAVKVSVTTILINAVLSVFKLLAGIFANSSAMLSDAVHSFSDVFSTVIVIAGIKIGGRKSDANHQYGHERFESLATILLALILLLVGVGIGYSGVRKIIGGNAGLPIPGWLALAAAIISIVVKEWMYWYTRHAAKKTNSGALMADAWHHRSDALSSIGSLLGILGARLGYPILDPLASVIICLFILKVAFDILKDTIRKITDEACDADFVIQLEELIVSQNGVEEIDLLRTRKFGNKVYVDLEIAVNGDMTLKKAHDISKNVHDSVEKRFPEIKHCMIHINPADN